MRGVGSDDRDVAPGEAQIRELIDRIDAYRQAAAAEAPAPQSFRWETGAEGLVLWVEGAPRSPLVGQSIARSASSVPAVLSTQPKASASTTSSS